MPTHGSFFSGIGGFDLGFERAGFRTVFQSEIDPFASSILRRHFPDVPNLGDITKLEDVPDADVWTGGFPCQDLSVAGRRAGLLGGSRSILALEFLRLARARRPAWIILENVPGLFTSHGGADFATLLDALDELGYFVAWRTLDARYFGVPQRRRRVFIVGAPSPEGAAAVLALEGGGRGYPGALREEGPDSASGPGGGAGGDDYLRQSISAKWAKGSSGPVGDEFHNLVVGPLQSPSTGGWRYDADSAGAGHLIIADSLRSPERDETEREEGRGDAFGRSDGSPDGAHDGAVRGSGSGGLRPTANAGRVRAATRLPGRLDDPRSWRKSRRAQTSEDVETWEEDPAFANTLNLFDVGGSRAVHLIEALEEEEDPELHPERMDSPRYRVLGNAVAVPVAEWIGRRLRAVMEGDGS